MGSIIGKLADVLESAANLSIFLVSRIFYISNFDHIQLALPIQGQTVENCTLLRNGRYLLARGI
jgi:hypothetical protein